jgi:hypothetical protein
MYWNLGRDSDQPDRIIIRDKKNRQSQVMILQHVSAENRSSSRKTNAENNYCITNLILNELSFLQLTNLYHRIIHGVYSLGYIVVQDGNELG